MPEFLLELGCEEMPAAWLSGLGRQLETAFEVAARREQLSPEAVKVLWTPRRLALSAKLLERQPDREVEVWGPSLKVARDGQGQWTKAAQGFARKCGVSPDDLATRPKDAKRPDEEHLLFVRRDEGQPAQVVLEGLLGGVLRGLSFPKRMNWDAWLEDGKGSFPFGRPIRWLVALLGGQPVPFVIYDGVGGSRGEAIVSSGKSSRGHRFLPPGKAGQPFEVSSAAELQKGLRERFVLLDPAERAARIAEQLDKLAGAGAAAHPQAQEWRDLVEHPSVLVGRIPDQFQELPVEVLQTVLVHHQKYIPFGDGRQVTSFAAVTDTDGRAGDEIVRGMERVVVARLRDGAFFYKEDMKRPLAERVGDLAGVTFHQALGSYEEKARRMARLVDAMGAEMGLLTKPECEAAHEAALLAKADLTTAMVGEFPELQGVMGGIYLLAQGHSRPEVAAAVRWHYHPLSIEEDAAPAGALSGIDATVFGAVSLVDKLDTLAGYFGIGEEPTGSRDPYGLRRAAQGAVRVLVDLWTVDPGETRPSLVRLVEEAVAGYGDRFDQEKVSSQLRAFLSDRLEYVLTSRGFPSDEVLAVLQTSGVSPLDDPHDCLVRLKALHRVRSEAREDFEHLAVAFKRAKNILEKGAPEPGVEPELFREAAERELNEAVGRLEGTDGSYEERLRSLATLRGPVDRFFDDVLVMAEDPDIRNNRLGLLGRALSLFYRIADISKLGGKA